MTFLNDEGGTPLVVDLATIFEGTKQKLSELLGNECDHSHVSHGWIAAMPCKMDNDVAWVSNQYS